MNQVRIPAAVPAPRAGWRASRSVVLGILVGLSGLARCTQAGTTTPPPRVRLTLEHVDIRVLYQPAETNKLTIALQDEDHGITYASNQVALVVAEAAKLILPADYPFGRTGDPLWVLPQTQDPALLYLGLSAEDRPAGSMPPGLFSGTLDLRFLEVTGPGNAFIWQATGLGELDLRLNSADGLGPDDQTDFIIGSHEHLNYGFTAPGVYQLVLQVFGRRLGVPTNDFSLPTPIQFDVEPLPSPPDFPFAAWQSQHWPGSADLALIGPAADPDGDGLVNLLEYAFGLNPNAPSRDGRPEFQWVIAEGTTHGAVRFRIAREAVDVQASVQVRDDTTPGGWSVLSGVESRESKEWGDWVTVRDSAAGATQRARFYRVQIQGPVQATTTPAFRLFGPEPEVSGR